MVLYLSSVVEDECMLEVAGVVKRFGFGVNRFHEVLIHLQDL